MYASAQPLDFLARDEKYLLSESETASVLSGVSGWTLNRSKMSYMTDMTYTSFRLAIKLTGVFYRDGKGFFRG